MLDMRAFYNPLMLLDFICFVLCCGANSFAVDFVLSGYDVMRKEEWKRAMRFTYCTFAQLHMSLGANLTNRLMLKRIVVFLSKLCCLK
jgi:hypothetical protein